VTAAESGPGPEFRRLVAVDRLLPEGRHLDLEASADECRALAERFGLDALDALTVTATVRPLGSSRRLPLYEAEVTVTARVHQTCGITLAPLEATVTETLCQRFGGEGDSAGDPVEVEVDPEAADDPPEPLVDGGIDVGELAAEALGLAIDPHPRALGAVFAPPPEPTPVPEPATPTAGPFAALAGLVSREGPKKNGS